MTNEEIFEIWAPPGGRWSPWVKPVLFACMNPAQPHSPSPTLDITLDFLPVPSENVAIIFDLPGSQGVAAGMGAARKGYRPVPLYNAVPGPNLSVLAPIGVSSVLVNVLPIMNALLDGSNTLQHLAISPDAPPAFLLDSDRRGEGLFPSPGQFDNRSVSFTTDFPSALFLASHGIQRAILVQQTGDAPQPDLAHILRRWQEGGISIELMRLDIDLRPVPITVQRPSAFRLLWQRALALAGLRRSGLGGFGGLVPTPSSG